MEKLPVSAGLSYNSDYAEELFTSRSQVGWVEVNPDQFLPSAGQAHHLLDKIAAQYPLAMYARGFSIGSAESLAPDYLAAIKKLIERYRAVQVSTGLSWTRWQGTYLSEPLPLPYTEETLDQVSINLKNIQSTLGRRILVKNPAVYIYLDGHEMSEGAFMEELIRHTGCGFSLDLNNLYISATNTGQDPFKLLTSYPLAAVQEIHLSGHSPLPLDDSNMLLVNDRAAPVSEPVWRLFHDTLEILPKPVATLLDWRHDLPTFAELLDEVKKVNSLLEERAASKGAYR